MWSGYGIIHVYIKWLSRNLKKVSDDLFSFSVSDSFWSDSAPWTQDWIECVFMMVFPRVLRFPSVYFDDLLILKRKNENKRIILNFLWFYIITVGILI